MSFGPSSLQKVVNPNYQDAGYQTISSVNAQGSNVGSAGSSAQLAGSAGNIGTFISGAGQASATAATATVLATLPIPASAFDIAQRVLTINAAGKFGSTGNNKTLQLYFGTDVQTVGSPIVTTNTASMASSGVQTTNGGGWNMAAQVVKYGAGGSNTQLGINMGVIAGGSHLGTSAPVALTANEAAVTYVTLTGTTPTAGSDILANWLELAWNN